MKLYQRCTLVGGYALLLGLFALHVQAERPNGGRYKAGWYTLTDGTRHAGQLRQYLAPSDSLTRIEIAPEKGEMPRVFTPNELRSVVISADSMAVSRFVELEDTISSKPITDLAHVVMVGKATLLMRREWGKRFSDGRRMPLTRWGYQKAGTSRCYLLPLLQDDFQKKVAPLFFEQPSLCQRIRSGEAAASDVKRIFYAYKLKTDISQVTFEQANSACRLLVWD